MYCNAVEWTQLLWKMDGLQSRWRTQQPPKAFWMQFILRLAW